MKTPEKDITLTKSTLWLMTVGAGLVVANNYYNLPLLGMIAKEFGVSESATSKVPMFTQIGYAMGLLLIIPLGDMLNRKRVILIDFIFILISLLAFALCQSLTVMIISSFFIGLTSVVPQIFVPIAAQLSKPEDKGKNIGIVMSGLLIGILGSRVFSGLVAEFFGWRSVFFIGAIFMVVLGLLIARLLPDMKPTFEGTYGKLMGSILQYAKEIPSLRLAALRGALGLGSFFVFWTTLTFRLEQAPFFAGSGIAGLLGIFGIGGALAASFAGYASGKISRNLVISICCSLMILSWIVFGLGENTYLGIIIGIVLLDMGLQGMHITNQTIVFATHPEATNRLNTVYMVSYFAGGSFGTFVGGLAWEYYGWTGVVYTGILFVVLCLATHLCLCNKSKYKV